MAAIGRRIEGLRGNLSQAEFAARLGVDRKTVGTWERGERLPDTRALLGLWGEFDADPAWVLTGKGFQLTTTEDERELTTLFRAAPLAVKAAAVGALKGGTAPDSPKATQVFHGEVGQLVKGNQRFEQPVTINVGSRKRKKE